jgi:hypothetical protein
MAKFRKKPVVIEAFQWDGTNVQALAVWAAKADCASRKARGLPPPDDRQIELPLHVTPLGDRIELEIATLEGTHHASPGDWIICGVHGEFYPCKPDIFDKTYEVVEEPKLTVFRREECIFAYCPHPDLCSDEAGGCVNKRS